MSVLLALMAVILMQHATTLKGVTPALATVDTQAMGLLAQVRSSIFQSYVRMTLSVSLYTGIRLNNRMSHINPLGMIYIYTHTRVYSCSLHLYMLTIQMSTEHTKLQAK